MLVARTRGVLVSARCLQPRGRGTLSGCRHRRSDAGGLAAGQVTHLGQASHDPGSLPNRYGSEGIQSDRSPSRGRKGPPSCRPRREHAPVLREVQRLRMGRAIPRLDVRRCSRRTRAHCRLQPLRFGTPTDRPGWQRPLTDYQSLTVAWSTGSPQVG